MNRFCILHIEDDENDVFLLERAFNDAGIAVARQVVHDGQEAIDYLLGAGEHGDRNRFPLPRLIILDLKMPRKGGLEVLEWLRDQPTLSSIPVIVLSSSGNEGDIDRAYEFGANSFVVKPGSMEKRLELVEHIQGYWLEFNETPRALSRVMV